MQRTRYEGTKDRSASPMSVSASPDGPEAFTRVGAGARGRSWARTRPDTEPDRRRVLARASLAFLAFNAASLGVWATFAPRSWFESFPGAGHHWVGLDGPYNQHLAGDVGALSLALAVVTAAALSCRSQATVRAVGGAWLLSALPHLVYHLSHRGHLPGGDQVVSLAGLGLEVVLAAVCVVAAPADPTESV